MDNLRHYSSPPSCGGLAEAQPAVVYLCTNIRTHSVSYISFIICFKNLLVSPQKRLVSFFHFLLVYFCRKVDFSSMNQMETKFEFPNMFLRIQCGAREGSLLIAQVPNFSSALVLLPSLTKAVCKEHSNGNHSCLSFLRSRFI